MSGLYPSSRKQSGGLERYRSRLHAVEDAEDEDTKPPAVPRGDKDTSPDEDVKPHATHSPTIAKVPPVAKAGALEDIEEGVLAEKQEQKVPVTQADFTPTDQPETSDAFSEESEIHPGAVPVPGTRPSVCGTITGQDDTPEPPDAPMGETLIQARVVENTEPAEVFEAQQVEEEPQRKCGYFFEFNARNVTFGVLVLLAIIGGVVAMAILLANKNGSNPTSPTNTAAPAASPSATDVPSVPTPSPSPTPTIAPVVTSIPANWTQLGQDLVGDASGDQFGWSSAISGNGTRVAIGGFSNDANGRANSGHVRVYQWNGTIWEQIGGEIAGKASNDNFGASVALSSDGTVLAVGADRWDNDLNPGYVSVYQLLEEDWVPLGLDLNGKEEGDRFGSPLALSADGTVLAVSATHYDPSIDQATHPGHVRVYQWNETAWEQQGADINGTVAADSFGQSVALSSDGTSLVVGAPEFDMGRGSVHVYSWNGSGWGRVGGAITGESEGDNVGVSVALSANATVLAVGAPSFGSASRHSHTRVFHLVDGDWSQIGSKLNGENGGDSFGRSVDLSTDGSVLAVGASLSDGPGSDSGHLRIFQLANEDWVQLGSPISGKGSSDHFGTSLALSADGQTVVGGADQLDRNRPGYASVYRLTMPVPHPDWSQFGEDLVAFGSAAVAISQDGNVVAVGARSEGRVYVYQRNEASWGQLGSPIDGSSALFGYSVALSGNGTILAAGAPFSNQVRVLRLVNGEWTQIGPDLSGDNGQDRFGQSVALSADGTILAVGAHQILAQNASGYVRIFQLSLEEQDWSQVGTDVEGENSGDLFGTSIALSADGTIFASGARYSDSGGSASGQARVFQVVNDDWSQVGSSLAGENTGDHFGYSVSLSSDGSILAVGAWYNDGDDNFNSRRGQARVFRLADDDWSQVGSALTGINAGDQLGRSVSLSANGTMLAVGAHYNDGNGKDSGHVRVFHLLNETWVQYGSSISGKNPGDTFGFSVALAGDGRTLAGGADGYASVYRWEQEVS